MTVGFRVLKRRRQVDAAMAEKFRAIAVANISDEMARMTAGGTRLRPMHAGGRLSGPAVTVKTRPGDNLMVHKAIDIAEPGDVLVVDAGGDLTNSIMGELMLMHMIARKLGGIVIDGAVRDTAFIGKSSFPVYAAGVTHRGPYKNGPGEINVPVAIDGMVVEPGDLIVGDEDGLLCIPYGTEEALYRVSLARQKHEEKLAVAFSAGTPNRAWIDETLKSLNCEIEE